MHPTLIGMPTPQSRAKSAHKRHSSRGKESEYWDERAASGGPTHEE